MSHIRSQDLSTEQNVNRSSAPKRNEWVHGCICSVLFTLRSQLASFCTRVCVTVGVNRPFFREKQVIRVFRVLLKIFFLGKIKSWYPFGSLQHFEEGVEFSVTFRTLGTTGLESRRSERPLACVVGLAWFSVSGFSKTRTHPRTHTHTSAHTNMHTLFQANRLPR